MKLADLLHAVQGLTLTDVNGASACQAEQNILSITSDSREVKPGSFFVALSGEHTDGHQYVMQAIEQGATAILVDERQAAGFRELAADRPVVLATADTSLGLALLASAFYGYPGRQLRMIGVTGTNGKTTVTHLIDGLLKQAGRTVGLIGTLGIRTTLGGYQETGHTTPMAPQLQALLRDMCDSGVQDVVMEVSSHALAQHRVAGCEYEVAVITNLTQDHLDFHKTMERYADAKALLFEQLNPATGGKTAIINRDDAWADRFLQACPPGVRRLTYGIRSSEADIQAEGLQFGIQGASFNVVTPQEKHPVTLQLAGEFSVYNALAALAAGLALGVPLVDSIEALSAVPGVAGRFEVVAERPYVLVDYAHTPDGLANVLRAARQVTPPNARLYVVFGCGGDRDATKRPKMGRLAETLADRLIVTSDNPRGEDPQQIITDILAGLQQFDPTRMRVNADRASAIHEALAWSESPDDVIVIAGKGHETYQILADRTIDFDDKAVVQAWARKQSAITQ